MSPVAAPHRATATRLAGSWVDFYAVVRRYVDLARVASATCQPGCAH